MDIQPGILVHSEDEFRQKIAHVRELGLPVHIDVMDGVFVNNTTWADPGLIHELAPGLEFEVHLMIANPEHAVPIWIAAGAKRVIYHKESTERDRLIFEAVADEAKRLGIAINPETPVSALEPIIDQVAMALVMSVTPGASGQAFQPAAVEKVAELKKRKPSLVVGVDGGVRPENIKSLKDAGADMVVATSALTETSDPSLTIQVLKQALGE
ncbi:ribulose-phosphate 3-epimerase [Candidatus Uhrbacteria bacterium]|nr:ribulose-phosphate 3-epimerase [Candidatus Uhrbacteria bacterium]